MKVHSELISQAGNSEVGCSYHRPLLFDGIRMMQEPFGFLTVQVRRLARLQLGTSPFAIAKIALI